jgi:hypothetical protein
LPDIVFAVEPRTRRNAGGIAPGERGGDDCGLWRRRRVLPLDCAVGSTTATTIMITMIIMVADTVIGTIAAACVSRSRPQWRVKTHIDEPAGVAGVSIQPIRDVLCAGKPHDADGGGRAVQRLHRRQRLLASGLVVVFKYENVAAAQHLDEFGRPVAAAGERGRAVAQCGDAIRVLLAFANEDGAVRVLQQFRQPIQHAADVAELIHPAAVAVRPALAKSLRLVSLHLVEQRAAFVAV